MYRILIFFGVIILCSCEEQKKPTTKKEVELHYRKYDTTGSYKTNPIYGNRIENSVNSKNESITNDNKIKIDGKRIDFSKLKQPKKYTLETPKRINTKGIINIPLDTTKVQKRLADSNLFLKKAFNFSEVSPARKGAVKLRKIKTKIPPLSDAKTPIYKGKAIKNIKYLDVKQGTSSSYIWDVFHDSKSQIWMGTNGAGVSVYTGDKFRHFNEDHGLSNNFIWCIEEDRQGNMWFGTLGQGVCMFDGNNFFRLESDRGFKATDIRFIYEDKTGLIWIGSKDYGVYTYNGKTLINYTINEGLLSNKTQSIYEDDKNRKWICTSKGINIIDGDSIMSITKNEGLKSNDVTKIIQDGSGNFWIAYLEQGIDILNGKSFTNYNSKNFLNVDNIYDLLLDKYDNVWIASYSRGICQFDGNEFTWINESNGLSGEHVLCLENDKSGNVWAGTDGDGLDIINLKSFQNLNEGNGLINDYIYAICEDKQNRIWFGGEDGGLMIYKENHYFELPQFNALLNKQINKIYEDTKGNIWIATEKKGVIKISGSEFMFFNEDNGLISNQIYEIIEDNNGTMWFGSSKQGLCSFDGRVFTHFNESNGLYTNQIKTSSKDLNGNLFFGTWGAGVIKYDGEYFHHITEKEGLNSSVIISSFNDSKGRIWFGSLAHGSCMFDGSSFHYFSTKTGLSDNKIWSIIEDTISSSIWIGTENGLNQLQNIELGVNKQYNCMSYNWNDGIRCVDFLKSSAIADHSGSLWWGTGKGLTKLIRKNLPLNNSVPIVRLRDISINNRYIDYLNPPDSLKSKTSYSSVNKFENVPKNLVLSYDNNHLTFVYSAINWFKPQGISYSYMLEGLDENWSPPTRETHADFTNLPDGSYIFKVKSRISGGEWSEPLEYSFTINPPWWYTWWAKTGYILLGVLLIWLFILQRTRRLRLRQLRLVKEIKSATSEIREKKNEVERQKNSNLEMSKRILEQDKQLILSATANTVAHSLNSPLGAIKAGAESIIYIYNDIFSNVIQKCSPQQITYGYKYAKKYNGSLIESGIESLSRITTIKEHIHENFELKEKECEELSVLIGKVYIESELKSITEFIIKQENKTDVIKMIISLVTFEQITSNTINATQKSSKVVESLKNALKKGRADKKVSVNVHKSIKAVMEVLDDEIQKSGVVKNIIDKDLFFNNTNEYKFFQLWSNLFTLLLNSSEKEVLIQIQSEKQNGNLILRFEVNFKLNEDLFEESVYDIIMNKKQNSIDLSRAVIKDIIQEYNGSVSVKNNQLMSVVSIQIPINQK
ncbi:hypothetical protein N9335_02800 [Crocinitomicaceae bacterium]|nr:hypothetical protein [Crocinitomicaceae bacterium]